MLRRMLAALVSMSVVAALTSCVTAPTADFLQESWRIQFDAPTVTLGLSNGHLIVEVTRDENRELIAIDPATGDYLWNRVIGNASPSLIGDQIILSQSAEESALIVGLDPQSGDDVWQKLLTTTPDLIMPGPVFVNVTLGSIHWSDLRSVGSETWEVSDDCWIEKVVSTSRVDQIFPLVSCADTSSIVGLSLPALKKVSESNLGGPGNWDAVEHLGTFTAISSSMTSRTIILDANGNPIATDDAGLSADLILYGDVLGIVPQDRSPYFLANDGSRVSPSEGAGIATTRDRTTTYPFSFTIFERVDSETGNVLASRWEASELTATVFLDSGRSAIQALSNKDGWALRRVSLLGLSSVASPPSIDLNLSANPRLNLRASQTDGESVVVDFTEETSQSEGNIAILRLPSREIAEAVFANTVSDMSTSDEAVVTSDSVSSTGTTVALWHECLIRVSGSTQEGLAEGVDGRVADAVMTKTIVGGCSA